MVVVVMMWESGGVWMLLLSPSPPSAQTLQQGHAHVVEASGVMLVLNVIS